MLITVTVTAELERTEGKFASRDELTEKIAEALESADPGSVDTDNGATYEVTEWNVQGS